MAADGGIILVDALNVAYWQGTPPSLRLPLALMGTLLASGFQARACFDASAPHRLPDAGDLYARLLLYPQHFIQVRSGIPADRWLLKYANTEQACVLSRDRFHDHRRRYRRLIDDPARLFGGAVVGERIVVPALNLAAPLPASVEEAWTLLEACLPPPAASNCLA
jgi:hypothetical protein